MKVLGILMIFGMMIPFGAWVFGASPYFHSYQQIPNPPNSHNPDPMASIYDEDSASFTNDFNFRLASYAVGIAGADGFVVNSNTTDTAVVLTKSSFDLSPASAKELQILNQWNYYAGGVTGSCVNCSNFGWYLTRNATLPTQKGYNPINDPQVSLLFRISQPNSTFVYNVVYIQHNPLTPISQEAITCGSQGTACFSDSPFVQVNGVGGSTCSTAFANPAFLGPLNFTGSSAASGSGNSRSQIYTGNNKNVFCQNVITQNKFPWLSLTGNFYLGFYQIFGNAGSTGVLWYRDTHIQNTSFVICLINATQLTCAMSIAFGTEQQTTQAPPPTTDTGGFFGPIIRALISIGVFIAQNIISFAVYLVNFLVPLLSTIFTVFSGVIKGVLDAIGNAIGLGPVGTAFFNFLGGIATFLTQIAGAIFSSFVTIINFFAQLISFLQGLFGGSIWTQILAFVTLASGGLSTLLTGFGYMITFGGLGINYLFLADWIYGMFRTSWKGIDGFKSWIDLNELALTKIARGGYWFVNESIQAIVRIKQMVAQWV